MAPLEKQKAAEALKHDPMTVMREWVAPPFLTRNWMDETEVFLPGVMAGTHNLLVVGEQGVGKTEFLRRLDKELNQGKGRDLRSVSTAQPCFYMSAAPSRARRTAMDNLLEQLRGGAPLKTTEKGELSISPLTNRILDELAARGKRLVIIDEANLLTPEDVDVLRLVHDRSKERSHPVGLLLSGTPMLSQIVEESGHQGQRFPHAIHVGPLKKREVRQCIAGFHPVLPEIARDLEEEKWRELIDHCWEVTRGNLRRMSVLVTTAHDLALKMGRPMTAEHLRAAADTLRNR